MPAPIDLNEMPGLPPPPAVEGKIAALPRSTAYSPPPMSPAPAPNPQQESRAKLAEAIMKATGGGEPQPVQHPTQAIGNAMQQIASANLQRQQAPAPPMMRGAAPPAGPGGPRMIRPPVKRQQMMRPGAGMFRRPSFKPGG